MTPDAGSADADNGTKPPPPDTSDGPEGVELNSGWIGGPCGSAADCNSADFSDTPLCETSGFPNGFCTQACAQSQTTGAWICPDTDYGAGTNNTVTRCISADGVPRCAAECDIDKSPSGCRPDYACVLRQRHGQPGSIFPVCMPEPAQVWPGEAPLPNDIGQACDGPQDCGSLECLKMPNGYCSKSMCDLAGCPSGSTCFAFETSEVTSCLDNCTTDSQCRTDEGYVCDTDYGICWPGTQAPNWDPSVGAADCASSWGNFGEKLHACDKAPDDYVVINKKARNLALCKDGALVDSYNIGLGFAPTGDKKQEGDGKTPHGVFYVAKLVPNSQYYKAFLLSYPDSADAAWGVANGVITSSQQSAIDGAQAACEVPPQYTGLGGLIEIHGLGGGEDWTWGCAATDNAAIDDLWDVLAVDDTIVVLP